MADLAKGSLEWWQRYPPTDFNTVEDVTTKIFGINFDPHESEDEQRLALKRMTDAIVDRVITKFSRSRLGANTQLHEFSNILGCHPHWVAYKYESVSHICPLAWHNFGTWKQYWRQHFALIVIGYFKLDNLKTVVVSQVPRFIHRIDTTGRRSF